MPMHMAQLHAQAADRRDMVSDNLSDKCVDAGDAMQPPRQPT